MASTIKVDNVQNQPGTNIINKCGTTITLGASSDTIALAAGASQTGFGRTGTVDWITTPKVTGDSPITGVTGKGYFLNTTAGTITLNLPAGAAGSIVSMADYAATWQTTNVTVSPNGSDKIGGLNDDVTLNTEGQSVTFVYADSTQGWLNTMDSTSNIRATVNMVATGGNSITTDGNYKAHIFTGPGTFTVCSVSPVGPNNALDYLIVGGGGGGGKILAGAGGAGGFRQSPGTATGSYTVSPLGVAPAAAFTAVVQGYPIAVGGGGPQATIGSVSTFNGLTAAGGGGGISGPGTQPAGGPGGSGGGANGYSPTGVSGGTGNTPPVTPPQGNDGGGGGGAPPGYPGGGGGGATAVGGSSASSAECGQNGGDGGQTNICGTLYFYSGGGGGAGYTPAWNGGDGGNGGGGGGGTDVPGCGGAGGPGRNTGGAGTASPEPAGPSAGGNGGDNTGGGGGGGAWGNTLCNGGTGGSGVVIIRYKYAN